jgi:hypothetical protein
VRAIHRAESQYPRSTLFGPLLAAVDTRAFGKGPLTDPASRTAVVRRWITARARLFNRLLDIRVASPLRDSSATFRRVA